MSGIVATLIVVAVITVPLCVLCETDEKHESRQAAKAAHPSNKTALDEACALDGAAILPLICPVCGVTFGHSYLTESHGMLTGWVEKRAHECVKQVVA